MKKLFKAGAFIIACAGITLFAMETSQQSQTIKVLTSDGQEVAISRHLALQSSTIKNAIGDTNESDAPLPLPNVNTASLNTIIAILAALDNADQNNIKRSDGKYIAQRIQPIIDQAVANQTPDAIADAAMDAEYLDLEQIANGLIRAVVSRVQAQNPQMTPDGSNTAYTKIRTASYLIPILEKQYSLVTNGNISELSIADYIAMNKNIPQMSSDHIGRKTLRLVGLNLTSLDGLSTIEDIQTVQSLTIVFNKISNIDPNTLATLTNLEALRLDHNNISNIDALAGLTNLKEIFIAYNNISNIDALAGLTNLEVLGLADNNISNIDALAGLTNLEILSLTKNNISSITPNTLAGLTNLKTLNLDQNNISNIDALAGLTKLEYLRLAYNNIASIAPNALGALTNLISLHIHHNPISASINYNINQFKQDQGLPADTRVVA